MDTRRVILHVDLNSFFATCEQQANPSIRNKPVGVIKGRGRSCIIASSVDAKKIGIGTGFRVWDAKKICPNIILVPADFEKYSDISRRFIKICASYTPQCEVFSLDECFLDVTETERLWGTAFNIAFDIKKRIREEIGDYMTVSIGVSHNRLLAKLGSGKVKLDGLVWITKDTALDMLDRSKLTDVCGLGRGLYNHLERLGIANFPDLRACSVEFLHDNFGSYWGPYLWDICRGIDRTPVNSFRSLSDQKSVGRTYTTHRLLTKKNEIFKVMRNLCEEATLKARRMNLAGRYVGLSLREGRGGANFWGHRTLKTYIDDGKRMFEMCRLIYQDWDVREVIFCGVYLGMMTNSQTLADSLFLEETRKKKLTKSMDAANDKYGEYTVFPAQLLGMPIVMPEVTGYFGDKKYQLDFLRKADDFD